MQEKEKGKTTEKCKYTKQGKERGDGTGQVTRNNTGKNKEQ